MGFPMRKSCNRAQMMVISAIAIGFLIITIAILMNTSAFIIFTANAPENGGFENINSELYKNGETTLKEINTQYRNDSYKKLHDKHVYSAESYISDYEKQIVSQGQGISIELSSTTNGTLLGQSTERHFTSSSGDSSWTLVSSTEKFREFSLTIKEGTLVNGSALHSEGRKTSDFLDADAFRIYIDDNAGKTWVFYFYERTDDDIIFVRVETPDGEIHSECQVSDGSGQGTIDISNAIANEERKCPSLRFAEDLEKPVTIRYEDSTNAKGTYNLTVSKNRNLIDTSDFGNPLYADRILYSSKYDITYFSNKFTISKIIEIKPGDADGDYHDN